jgi:hypothetical protein
MSRLVHWFNQHGGVWPIAACDRIPGKENLTLAMGEVTCPECMTEILESIERLHRGEPVPPESWCPLPGLPPLSSQL